MLFSSSSFSISMDRIEKCAAAYIPEKNGEPTVTIFDTFMNELSDSQPDFEAIRSELQQFTEMLFSFRQDYFKQLFDNSWYAQRESEYSKACLQLLKRPDQPFSDAELALPFMIIDFLRMAADRFSNGDILALGGTEISFSDAVEFIYNLDMPAELRMLLADKKDQADLLAGGNEAWKTWQTKMAQPCQCCYYCMDELKTMHSLLNSIFGNVSDSDLPAQYIPAVLEPPYTLNKLFDNLVPNSCHFHDNTDFINYDAHNLFICFLQQLSEIRQDDPRKVLKIHRALQSCDLEDVFQDSITGEYTTIRDEWERDYPWCCAYFSWYDAVKTGEDQDNCILPEALKGDWETELSEFYNRLREEWDEIAPQAEDGMIHSPEKIKDFFIGRRQAFLNFLLEKTGINYDNIPSGSYLTDGDRILWRELNKLEDYLSIFKNGVPAPNASIEVIGDYLDEHSEAVKNVCGVPSRLTVSFSAVQETYIDPLFDRLKSEMERIASDKSIAVYLRETLLEKIVQLVEKISSRKFSGEDAQKILQKFRKKHELFENGSSFSHGFQKILNINAVETGIRRIELAEAAEAERRKVLFEMSHSIKNLMASVSEPLDMLKNQLDGTQRRTVENALAGAGLIRDLAVGVHMSMRGEPGTWRKDVYEPGFGAAPLDKIILDAVRHAVSNMFDGKYFAQFVKNYFGRDLNTFIQAQNEWKATVSAEDTFACINKYFFDFKIDCGESSLNIPIGDRDGTATKLLILFQELFLNAVKYSSFTEREKRFVKLDIAITQKNWNIKLSNSAVGRQNAKSSGIGLAVIKNFADLFEAKYDASCKNDTYISNINFSLNK